MRDALLQLAILPLHSTARDHTQAVDEVRAIVQMGWGYHSKCEEEEEAPPSSFSHSTAHQWKTSPAPALLLHEWHGGSGATTSSTTGTVATATTTDAAASSGITLGAELDAGQLLVASRLLSAHRHLQRLTVFLKPEQ